MPQKAYVGQDSGANRRSGIHICELKAKRQRGNVVSNSLHLINVNRLAAVFFARCIRSRALPLQQLAIEPSRIKHVDKWIIDVQRGAQVLLPSSIFED